jgi:hypothetical protein
LQLKLKYQELIQPLKLTLNLISVNEIASTLARRSKTRLPIGYLL